MLLRAAEGFVFLLVVLPAPGPVRSLVAHRRDHSYRLAVQRPEQETLRVGGMERVGVVQARVPALLRSPVEAQVEFLARH